MTRSELSGAFDPLDLEIIERAYEAAWTKFEKYNPQRDTSQDPEYKQTLRRTLFLAAREGISDPETLCDEVLVKMFESERPLWVKSRRQAGPTPDQLLTLRGLLLYSRRDCLAGLRAWRLRLRVPPASSPHGTYPSEVKT